MKKQLSVTVMLLISGITFAQTDQLWSKDLSQKKIKILKNQEDINHPKIYKLDINRLKEALSKAPKTLTGRQKSKTIISFPNSEGKMENFQVTEHSNLSPELEAKYPDIKSYVGQNTADPGATIYFSVSPLGLSCMEIYADKSAVFIEPYTEDLSSYVVYKTSDKKNNLSQFECSVVDVAEKEINKTNHTARPNADDARLRTFRLALSCTGEYTAYFGGTKANALAAMNNTMTHVNGIFEKDFSARMVLIANNDRLIYTNSTTDPYSNKSQWKSELQKNLTSTIGHASYDIGHLFATGNGGGNAGCIGCVCIDGLKGSGFTSPVNGGPSGYFFNNIVTHEMGHQFGANHTFSHGNEGTGANMEPGSGSTIMGYAGITPQDVQQQHDIFFHAKSIQQVTDNIKTKACPVSRTTGNTIPTADAGLDYTIPKGTPFMLTGTGIDTNGDSLTYIWEQMDSASSSQTGANSAASTTKESGPNFRSWTPTTSPIRYFPRMASVLEGATTTPGSEIMVEALSDVARSLNFRFTVRDNRPGGSGNNSDDALITVNETAGPFKISSQYSAVTYAAGHSKVVTWDVAGTTANNVNAEKVDILWSTDNGDTWIPILEKTPNDSTQRVKIPNTLTTKGRIMVKGSNHIFFDVNNADITVKEYCQASANDTTKEKIGNVQFATINNSSTGTSGYENFTSVSATVTQGKTYTISVDPVRTSAEYKEAYAVYIDYNGDGDFDDNGELAWSQTASATAPVTGSIIIPATATLGSTRMRVIMQYNTNPPSPCGSYTRGQVEDYTLNIASEYCSASANDTTKERIGNVKFGTINNSSTGTAGYENFTSLSTDLTQGNNYTISVTPMWASTAYNEAYEVYIDYNNDGSFADKEELVWSKNNSTDSPVTGNITIPATAATGAKRMRVIMQYDSLPTSSCGSITRGQVEDYTVNIISANNISSGRAARETRKALTDIQLHPNPADTILNISNTTSEEYKIFDMAGKLVNSGKLERGTVNVAQLPKGNYLIQIGDTVKKFIKD